MKIFQRVKTIFFFCRRNITKHKILSGFLFIIFVIGGYYTYGKLTSTDAETRYVLAAVQKGTLVTSISGSGQVSVSDQIDIKPKVSGDVIYAGVKNGQEVKAGTLLIKIDTSNAERAVKDAEINLETARVQLEELLKPPDELTILQAENSLAKAKEAKQKAESSIIEGYEDAYNTITDVFFDLPAIITNLNNILYSYEIANSESSISNNTWNISAFLNFILPADYDDFYKLEKFIKTAENSYKIVREKYDKNLEHYKDTSRYAEYGVIEALLEETLGTLRATAETIKSETNMLDFLVDYRSRRDLRIFSKVSGYQLDLKSYTSKTNSYLSNLLKVQRSFQDNRAAVLDAEFSIKEKELLLKELIEGPDDLDIRTKKNIIQQKEDALAAARENLAGCYIYAPFNGIVTEVYIKKGDSVSSGAKLLTLSSKQKLAEITLNEIDVAKVKIGQKATITLDAISDLTISGEVVEVDVIGTVSQGVVTYGIKVAFDTQDDRIKPGMSLSASIIIDVKQDVLLVPNSAVKWQGDATYVEIMANNAKVPLRQMIEVGLSNDVATEVISGLKEGEQVVTQTITANNLQQNQTQQSTSIRIPGLTGGATGGLRR